MAAALAAAGGGFALSNPPAHAHARAGRSHFAITGTVVGIDYGAASMQISTARGVVPVAVTPTTNIFRGGGLASFADLGRGARVTVDVSSMEGRLVAQIIRIH